MRTADERAGAETYFIATLFADTAEGERMTQLGGRYVDTLVREAGA